MGNWLSADDFIGKLRTGVALTVGHTNGLNQYRNSKASLAVSPKISVKGKYTFAPFIDFSFSKVHVPVRYLANNQMILDRKIDLIHTISINTQKLC